MVSSAYEGYLQDSITLYSHYHNFSIEKSRLHQEGIFDIITGEPAVKAQALNSNVGATAYLSKYLSKTDAESCSEIREYSDKILDKYGLGLSESA
ncbi:MULTISPECIES: hypothetical protein [Vibrio]|uniref:hypothetical protein n=1 Tax=Vibrio TaxID=662 RepID=UPI000B5CC73C|nr:MULTISPECIES: hypothetical protein [Vibrio]HBV75977.1 hypothetical protein [Vibrio sp.]